MQRWVPPAGGGVAVKTTKTETAGQAFSRHANNARRLADRIQRTMARYGKASPDWADVGDIACIEGMLQDLSDMLHNEGEYAPPEGK